MNFLQFVLKSVKFSPVRLFQYDELQKNELRGKVLDLGGGSVSSYTALCKGSFDVTSVNIDPKTKPTVVGDITKPLPFRDGSFDAVVSLNTFEHIFDFNVPVSEAFRVLKKGGKFIFSTPFLKEVHSSPDDYWRFTASAFQTLLRKKGFHAVEIVVLGKGIFVARYSLMYGIIPSLLKPFFAGWAWFVDKILSVSSRYRKVAVNYALGYFVYAEKP